MKNKILFISVTIVILLLFYKLIIAHQIITLKEGLGKIYCPYTPDFVCDTIRFTKIWEENLQKEFEKYVKPGDTVIDAGAYIGIHTIKLARLVGPTGMVYAFEVNPDTFKVLEKNIKLNNLNNVKLFNKGLSDEPGYIKLTSHQFWNKGADTWGKSESSNGIESITIDSLNLPRLNFMKIDVEGMENKVFIGMENTIKRYKPVIVFESFEENYDKNYNILTFFGYKITKIKDCDYIAK